MSNEIEYRINLRPTILVACDMLAKDAAEHGVEVDDLVRGVYEWVQMQLTNKPIPQWMKDDPSVE